MKAYHNRGTGNYGSNLLNDDAKTEYLISVTHRPNSF